MEGGFLDMMGSILGNNISNEIYFVYGLIAVVLILIVVILVMDHQAKRRLHKNLFNNTLGRNRRTSGCCTEKERRETIHSDYEGRTDCIEIF